MRGLPSSATLSLLQASFIFCLFSLSALSSYRDLLQWKGRQAPLPVIPGQWSAPEFSDDRTTFLAHALSLTALHGPGPWPDGGSPLPDEQSTDSRLLSSTVLDGIRTHHLAASDESPPITTLIDAVAAALSAPDAETLTALHDRLAEYRALDVADDLIKELRALDHPAEDLRALARWLAEHGTRRNAVALGIVMLGVAGDARDQELLLLLGALEDLTLYAIVALANSQPEQEQAIHRLAQRVDGWGRIHAVERLRGTQDPGIKSWLLRGGFRNQILNEYLAHLAATTGDLYTALLAPEVDDELLHGAAGILDALVALPGPCSDIRHYADALPCLARFGELIASAPLNLTLIDTAGRLKNLLKEPPPDHDWPEADISRLLGQYSALLARPDWSRHVRSALDQPTGESNFRLALMCSEAVGIDAYPHAVSRLRRPPHDQYVWYWAATHTPEPEYTALVRLAGQVLPLDEIAVGPDPERIIGSSDGEGALDLVLSYIGDARVAEADVLPLIRTALRGQGTRLRRIGLHTLNRLYGQDLPTGPRAWVSEAAAIEPYDELRANFTDLLERTKSADEK
ncbi:hypothetical protein [Nocardia sp. NPDC004711]